MPRNAHGTSVSSVRSLLPCRRVYKCHPIRCPEPRNVVPSLSDHQRGVGPETEKLEHRSVGKAAKGAVKLLGLQLGSQQIRSGIGGRAVGVDEDAAGAGWAGNGNYIENRGTRHARDGGGRIPQQMASLLVGKCPDRRKDRGRQTGSPYDLHHLLRVRGCPDKHAACKRVTDRGYIGLLAPAPREIVLIERFGEDHALTAP